LASSGETVAPLGRALLAGRPPAVLDHACPEPLLDQAQDPLIRDTVLKELHKPGMIEAGKEIPEIRVEHPSSPYVSQSRP
jgi:hypothetical protein